MHSISIIVPVRDDGTPFERCFDALAGAVRSAGELVVVLEGADEEARHAAERLAQARERTCTVHHKTSCGPAAARNAGARVARS